MNIGKAIGLPLGKATREAFGETLVELGRERPDIVVLDADLNNSTRTDLFARTFPDRFFNVGIAESNLVGVAGGLASCGKVPFVASFAAFVLCNAYDQLRLSVAFPALPVKVVGSHGGISIGEDGPSQMSIEDVALACSLPGFTVIVPADEPSTRLAVRAVADLPGPTYIRVGRPKVPVIYGNGCPFAVGRAIPLRDGGDATIVANGLMVATTLEAAHLLAQDGIRVRVLDMHTVKPVDEAAVAAAARDTGLIVTVEEHQVWGGLGAAVAQAAARTVPAPMEFVGLQDTYAESGKPEDLFQKYGLMAPHIAAAVKRGLKRRG